MIVLESYFSTPFFSLLHIQLLTHVCETFLFLIQAASGGGGEGEEEAGFDFLFAW